MNDIDDVKPSLPTERSASPASWQAGCIVAFVLALLPILYVASFAFLVVDSWNQWGVIDSLDEPTLNTLSAFYAPLIWLCEQTAAVVGFDL